MKNTPRGCLTAGGAKPPRVTPYISIQLVSVCKHSNWGYAAREGARSHLRARVAGASHASEGREREATKERGWRERTSESGGGLSQTFSWFFGGKMVHGNGKVRIFASETNKLQLNIYTTMSKKFVIGDRLKDEWISVLDTEKKKLEFTNHLATAKEYLKEEEAKENLQKLQETGYFSDLQIYMKEDNKAYKIDERDSFQS